MAPSPERTIETRTIHRLLLCPPVDAADMYLLLLWARQELNEFDARLEGRGPLTQEERDRDPGLGRIWIEPLGDTGDVGPFGTSRIAVCYETSETKPRGLT